MLSSEQKLQKIGESLYRKRTEQNLTLETIAAKTLISKRVLAAIEQGAIQKLPEPFYTKALIRKYAQAIGATDVISATDVLDEQEEQSEEITKKEQKSVIKAQKSQHSQSLPTFQLRASHLYFLYLVLVVIAVRAIAGFVKQPSFVDNPETIEKEIKVETATRVNNETPTTISSASPSQLISQSKSNNSESVVVDIALKDRCWLKVMVDGKVEFEGTLPKGTQRSWTGREQINIIAGNAGGVVITYNHGQEKLLGKPGQVEEVTYTVH